MRSADIANLRAALSVVRQQNSSLREEVKMLRDVLAERDEEIHSLKEEMKTLPYHSNSSSI